MLSQNFHCTDFVCMQNTESEKIMLSCFILGSVGIKILARYSISILLVLSSMLLIEYSSDYFRLRSSAKF